MTENGFIVAEDEAIANTRKGKQVLNLKAPDWCLRAGDRGWRARRLIGDNRKM